MGRVARKSYSASYFHVIVQGYEKQYIFKKEIDKSKYLELLIHELKRYKVELLEYCIMDNHAHMMIYCEENLEISKYMKSVNTKFAMYYNKEKNRVGYVFRDRFFSKPIMNKNYLYSCFSYIHMNPVVANLVMYPFEYKYSSYNNFIKEDGIVNESVILKLFGSLYKYRELFEFIHFSSGEGDEYIEDFRPYTIIDSEKIITDILHKYNLEKDELNDKKIQKYFYHLFLNKGIKASHIEKIFKVSRRKIGRIIKA